MPRSRRRTLDSITFRITLTGEELTRWHAAAEQRGIFVATLVHRAVERELAIVKWRPEITRGGRRERGTSIGLLADSLDGSR
jgi:hypothetical protein